MTRNGNEGASNQFMYFVDAQGNCTALIAYDNKKVAVPPLETETVQPVADSTPPL